MNSLIFWSLVPRTFAKYEMMTCLNDLVMISPRLWHKYHLHGLWQVGLGWDISSQECPAVITNQTQIVRPFFQQTFSCYILPKNLKTKNKNFHESPKSMEHVLSRHQQLTLFIICLLLLIDLSVNTIYNALIFRWIFGCHC